MAGSWGVGDVEPTVRDVLAADVGAAGLVPVVLCGRNDALREKLAAYPGVVALGWTDRMPEILGAADVLIQNTGGMSCMEAFAVGLPVLSYRCLAGHGHHNAATMAEAGVAPHARDASELGAHLRDLFRCGPQEAVAVRAASDLFRDEPTRPLVALATAPGRLVPARPAPARRRPVGSVLAGTTLTLTLLGAGATGVPGATDPDDLQFVAHDTAVARTHVVTVLDREVSPR